MPLRRDASLPSLRPGKARSGNAVHRQTDMWDVAGNCGGGVVGLLRAVAAMAERSVSEGELYKVNPLSSIVTHGEGV